MRNMKCTLQEQSINIQSEITNENSSKGEGWLGGRRSGVSCVGECLKHVTQQGPPCMSCGEREAGGPTCAHIVVGFYFFKEKENKLVFESSQFL